MPDIVDMLQALPPAVTPGPAGPGLAAADVARGHRAVRQRRRRRLTGVAGTVAVGAAAAVLVATSAQQPAGPARPAAQAPAVNSPLMTLAARISANAGSRPGNASLEIVRNTSGGKLMQVYYGLYTDGGRLYSGDDKQTLMMAVARHANQADGADFRAVAAARSAAGGDLAIARVRMVNATPNDFFLSFAARKKIWKKGAAERNAILREKGVKTPLKMPTGKALQDQISNSVWINSTDALNWAGGDPEIRAGVLRLLSTIPKVTVAHSTTDGQPTLTITAGPPVFGGAGDEVLTVNATTGLPLSSVSTTPGVPAGVETYRVSRVTVAGIEAGKF
jgi:hypothetical protein